VPVKLQVVERLQKLFMLIRLTDTPEKLPDAYGYTCFCRELVSFNLYKYAIMAALPSNTQ
jgi:hypothetical protein